MISYNDTIKTLNEDAENIKKKIKNELEIFNTRLDSGLYNTADRVLKEMQGYMEQLKEVEYAKGIIETMFEE